MSKSKRTPTFNVGGSPQDRAKALAMHEQHRNVRQQSGAVDQFNQQQASSGILSDSAAMVQATQNSNPKSTDGIPTGGKSPRLES